MTGYRLASGGRIDRARSIGFRWDGRALSGHPGDSLASALMASGQRAVGRSFKYHRPRGIMSAGVEESNAYVTIGRDPAAAPNTKATMVELVDGLQAFGQNAWPNVRFDLGSASSLLSPFLPAGFYYKTFIGPFSGTRFWMFCEHFIRRSAGMGRASRAPDPDHYERANAFCDLLVVGSGPAGLAAAEAGAEAGLEVILAEQDFSLGGSLLSESGQVEGMAATDWLAARESSLRSHPRVRIFPRTTVFGLYDGGVAGMHERSNDAENAGGYRSRFWVVRAARTIVAAGAHERGIAFPGNDRPGVMLASASRCYVNRFGVAPGRRAVVVATNDSGYEVARDLAEAGIAVTLADSRPEGPPQAGTTGFEVLRGMAPRRVLGGRGAKSVELAPPGEATVKPLRLRCDVVAVSGGWNPAVHLLCHRGIRPDWDEDIAAFVPPEETAGFLTAGSVRGIWNTDACVVSGRAAGSAAARELGGAADGPEYPPRGGWEVPIQPVYEVRIAGDSGGKSFVDLQNDVSAADIRLSVREGYSAAEHVKRYTTLGMSPDQGKTSNVIGLGILSEERGLPLAECGITTFRPPYEPVEIGALAGRARGRHFRPIRRTPAHHWHYRNGALMIDSGLWKRPWYYPEMGEGVEEAYVREAETARKTVGLADVSTLGKIAVQGPDAPQFLDHVYVNGFSQMPVGRARYGVMLRDDGIVFDDGTTWRLSEHEFFMTATTAQAGPVMAWLENLLATRFPELRVHVTSVTDQWAAAAVAGPNSRTVLERVVADLDMSDEGFPYMGVREGQVRVSSGTIPCRIARISFSGELGYEVYVESDYGDALMSILSQEVRREGGAAYGLEALGALRVEKGHVTVAELDGRVSLGDAGLGRMASKKKPFIGKVLGERPELQSDDRPRLVGVFPVDESARFVSGSILCAEENVAGHGEGWVTAVTHSPALGHWIGLGFARGGAAAWEGQIVVVADPVNHRRTRARIVSPHMFDPAGERLRG